MAMAYGCRFPLHGREWEHHILVGPPTSSLGVGHHRHVQRGLICTGLVVPCDVRRLLEDGLNANLGGCAYLLHVWMWERFTIARSFHHDPQVLTYLVIFIMYTLC
jgi:hypothetical protein